MFDINFYKKVFKNTSLLRQEKKTYVVKWQCLCKAVSNFSKRKEQMNNQISTQNENSCDFTSPKHFDCENNTNLKNQYAIFDKSCRIVSKLSKEKMWEEAQKTKLNIYVKTLLEAYRTLPNVIKILDQIIESRASNAMLSGGLFSSTYDEIDKVIELSERKDKLLNLYVICDNMLRMLPEKQRKFAIMKFVKKRSIESIAEELGTTKRSVYRSANNIIKLLCIKLLERNWDTKFIEFQIGENEHWLETIFEKKLKEEEANNKRKNKQ